MDVLKTLSVSAPAREFDGVGEKRLAGGKPEGAAEQDFASRVLELRQERANRKEAGSEKPGRLEKHALRDSAQEEMSAHAAVAEIAPLETAPVADGAEIASPSGDAVDSLIDAVSASPTDASSASVAGAELLADEGNVVSVKTEAVDPLTEEIAAPTGINDEAAGLKADRNAAPLATPKMAPETSGVGSTRGELEVARPVSAAPQAAAPLPDGEAFVDDAPPGRAPSELKPAADAAVQSSSQAAKTAAPALSAGAAASVDAAERPLETMAPDTAPAEGAIAEGEAAAGAPKKEALTVTPAGVKLALDAQATPLAPSERPLLQAETALQAESAKPQAAVAQTKVDAPEAARQVFASIRADKGGGVDLRLDPPDLGRVRIQFSFERSDVVVATVSSERGETLDLMRRHAGDLARELQRAGFESVTLEFASGENKQPHSRDLPRGGVYDFSGDAIDAPSIVYISARADNRLDRLV